MKEEKARWGLDYRIVNEIMCSPEGDYASKRSKKMGISKVC